MPAYTIGGGGGPAGASTSVGHALDKPYDLYWPLTADQVQSINEMLDLLFKSVTKSASDIVTTHASVTSELQVVRQTITAARFNTLNSSEITLVAAPGVRRLHLPLQWVYEQSIEADTFSVAPTLEIRYDGLNALAIVTNRAISNAANRQEIDHLGSTGYSVIIPTTDVRNKALKLRTTADSTGGSGNFRVTLWYYTTDAF